MASFDDVLADPESRLGQFARTKMCKFHILKKCTKGLQCPFAHDQRQLRHLPDLRCTKLCKTLIQTGQCTNKSCSYAHSKEQLRSTGTFHKTKLCRFMQTGHCSLGAKCNFAHSRVELREPITLDGLEVPPGLALDGILDLLDEDDNDEGFESATDSSKHDGKERLFDYSPAYVSVNRENHPWKVTSETLADSLWSYAQSSQSQVGSTHLLQLQRDLSAPYLDWSGDWFGLGLHGYASQLDAAYSDCQWLPITENVVIDQQEEWKARKSKSVNEAPKMRSVRTSESTLCTLSDNMLV